MLKTKLRRKPEKKKTFFKYYLFVILDFLHSNCKMVIKFAIIYQAQSTWVTNPCFKSIIMLRVPGTPELPLTTPGVWAINYLLQ
jgi:hypothetical protein